MTYYCDLNTGECTSGPCGLMVYVISFSGSASATCNGDKKNIDTLGLNWLSKPI